MKKIILNKCFGGFDVSEKAYKLYAKKKGLDLFKYKYTIENRKVIYKYGNEEDLFTVFFTKDFGDNVEISNEDCEKYCLSLRSEKREDETLIEVIEELGKEASGRLGELEVVEIPDDAFYVIEEYDGVETLYYSKTEMLSK